MILRYESIASLKRLPTANLTAKLQSATTLAQTKGTGRTFRELLRHSRAATTTDVYMQEIPESVRATVNAINAELRVKPEEIHAD